MLNHTLSLNAYALTSLLAIERYSTGCSPLLAIALQIALVADTQQHAAISILCILIAIQYLRHYLPTVVEDDGLDC